MMEINRNYSPATKVTYNLDVWTLIFLLESACNKEIQECFQALTNPMHTPSEF